MVFPNLVAVNLYGNSFITDTGIENLVKNCTLLKELDIEYCSSLSDKSILAMAEVKENRLQN